MLHQIVLASVSYALTNLFNEASQKYQVSEYELALQQKYVGCAASLIRLLSAVNQRHGARKKLNGFLRQCHRKFNVRNGFIEE